MKWVHEQHLKKLSLNIKKFAQIYCLFLSLAFQVDGNWGAWKAWAPCSKTCGAGTQISSRLCSNPPPSNGGKECRGEKERSRECNKQSCPSKF